MSLMANCRLIPAYAFRVTRQSPSVLRKAIFYRPRVQQLITTKSSATALRAVRAGFSLGLVGVKALAATKKSEDDPKRLILSDRVSEGDWDNQRDFKENSSFDWRQFLSVLRPHLWHLFVAVVTASAVAMLNISIPQLLGGVVDIVARYTRSAGTDESRTFLAEIRAPAIKMVKLYLAQSALTFGYIYSLSLVGERVAAEMRRRLFSTMLRQDIAFFDATKTGEIVSRLTSDVQDFKSSFKLCISQGLRSLTQAMGCVVALYLISPQMTVAMVAVVPGIIAAGTLVGSGLRVLSRRAQAQASKATAVGEECICNVRTVRAFAMEDMETQLYDREVSRSQDMNETLGLGIGLFQGATNLFLNGIVLGTIYYGGYLMSSDELSAGDLMSFLVATQTIQRSLTQISLLFGHFVKGIASGARVFDFINMKPTIPDRGGKTIPFHSLMGDVEFRNINFYYPTRPDHQVLTDFSLRIPPGRMVALVGESGGGKSTVAALLERFYDCQEGSVCVDGINVKQLDPRWLRGKAIGYIDQEPVLFATSVMENIRYGRPDAGDEEVYEAAKAANAHEFINRFPEGYATVLGERGATVSGGQKQRIAIARALIKDPAILILDEATSALDAESEKIVQDALDTAAKNRTVLVIAHRLSTVRKADMIAVISNGCIREMGTHESLKRMGGLYADLIRQQEHKKNVIDGSEALIQQISSLNLFKLQEWRM